MVIAAPTTVARTHLTISWPRLPADFPLPDDPVDDEDHPLLAAALRQPLAGLSDRIQNALIVSNFALCAAINNRTICKAPDWMYVQPVEPLAATDTRRSYTPHTEGPIPQVVMEFLSATYGDEYSMECGDSVGKWFFYEQVIQVPTYVIFRPYSGEVEVYDLQQGHYNRQTPDANGRYTVPSLNLWLGVWQGSHEGRTGYWLRWWDAAGNLLPWFEELTTLERERAEQERQRAEQERQRAETISEELQRTQQEQEKLLAYLRSLGVDPNQVLGDVF